MLPIIDIVHQASAAVQSLLSDTPNLTISASAREFIAHAQLEPCVLRAIRLVGELFTVRGCAVVEKAQDPEFPDEWVGISVRAVGEINQLADAYDEYVRRWVADTPAALVTKVRLQLGVA